MTEDLLEELYRRADAEGLVNVAYTTTDSPLGTLLLAATPAGLVRLGYRDSESDDHFVESLARRVSPRVLRAAGRLDPVRRQLDEYFAGRRHEWDFPVDWRLVDGFARRVLEATAAIPFGSVSTYRRVAELAGNPAASRATGNALGSNPIPIVIPCHRVLRTGGGLGGYTGGLRYKEALLSLEGATLA